jgi:pimeloyl-ACP methyl ester carboxylesterase
VSLRCRPSTEAAVFRTAAGNGAWDVLAALALPVAIVAGRDEPNGPVTFVPAAVGALPHGTLVRRPDLGHFGPLEDPEGMAQDVAAWVEAHP